MSETRFVVEWDDDSSHLEEFLEQFDTPEKYADNEVIKDGKPVPFDAYLRTYGNIENYTVMRLLMQQKCNMGDWHTVNAVHGFDFYWGDSVPDTGNYPSIESLPEDFQETAKDMLNELEAGE